MAQDDLGSVVLSLHKRCVCCVSSHTRGSRFSTCVSKLSNRPCDFGQSRSSGALCDGRPAEAPPDGRSPRQEAACQSRKQRWRRSSLPMSSIDPLTCARAIVQEPRFRDRRWFLSFEIAASSYGQISSIRRSSDARRTRSSESSRRMERRSSTNPDPWAASASCQALRRSAPFPVCFWAVAL